MSFITAALSLTEAVTARDVVDQDKFKSGISRIIDGTVDCLNSSLWAKK